MTPGARLAAAIEIVTQILQARAAADAMLADWARANRFAGATDRRAIEARVYTVLRRLNECAAAFDGRRDARSLILGSLKLDGLDADGIAALCSDGPYAMAKLTAADEAILNLPLPSMDETWTRHNYPEWLHGELSRSLGESLPEEMQAMQARAPLDLRANRLKANRSQAQAALAREGISTDPLALTPDALRVRGSVKLESLEAFRMGLIEVQDAGSQAVTQMLNGQAGERIVDLCAGAGGKSLALASIMGNQGTILACDVDAKRLGRLAPRAVRCGATMIELTGNPYTEHPHLRPGAADAVLVDAPCSGTGTWRRNPEAKWTLDAARLQSYKAAQAEALDRAVHLVRPGGRILYVTCSLLAGEGADQAASVTERHPDVHLVKSQRLSPASSDTDGFFAALLERDSMPRAA